jgi:hypothetical protein
MIVACIPFTAAADVCTASGSVAAKPLSFVVNDRASGLAMGNSVIVGMVGEMRYHVKGLKPEAPNCAVASVSIGSLRYVLRADDTSVWPRTAGEGNQVVLAVTLRPKAAMKLGSGIFVSSVAGGPSLIKVPESDLIYVLAAHPQGSDIWSIFGFYDAIPDTPRLAQAMCQAAIGSLPVAAHYNAKTHEVSFEDASAFASFAGGHANGPCSVGPRA